MFVIKNSDSVLGIGERLGFYDIGDDFEHLVFQTKDQAWNDFKELFKNDGLTYCISSNTKLIYRIDGEVMDFVARIEKAYIIKGNNL